MAASDGDYESTAQGLINAVTDYAIFRIGRTGLIESWSAGAERIKGYQETEVVGQPTSIFYTPEEQAEGVPARNLKIAAEMGRFEGEGWRVRKDGSRFRAHVVIDPIFGADGALAGYAKVTRDISDKYELESTKEQLFQAQKTELVGRLTGGMAHDFNNILTAVLGCLDLIKQANADENATRILDAGIAAATRGQRLIAQLLAFSRKQVLKPQVTDAKELLEAFLPLLQNALGEKKMLVRTLLDPNTRKVMVDSAQLQSALLNLIVNARDAMQVGGQITIRTYNLPAPDSQPSQAAEQNLVAIEVEDTGIGMAADVVERAIEPFFTTKPVGQGSGLGLSQVYGFAAQSGGELQIESRLGEGTVVRLLLPAAQGETLSGPGGRTTKAILLVEDDAAVREVAVEMLRAQDYTVYSAEDAAEALAILQRDVPIDIMFSDIIMPGQLNGVELARRAVNIRPTLSVVLTSGFSRDALRASVGITDEVAFLAKPYRLQTLRRALSEALGQCAA
jgi:PAS domain S-box-containing protein